MRISDWSSDVCSSDLPVPGDARAGTAIRAGHFLHRGLKLPLGELDFAALNVAPTFADYLHSFAWLRDLAHRHARRRCADRRSRRAPLARHAWRNGERTDRKSTRLNSSH